MVQNPPEGVQRVIPYLLYKDAPAAIDFLTSAFGFEERFRMGGEGGLIMHAELGCHDSIIMLASLAAAMEQMRYKDSSSLPGTLALTVCYVDDVDAHFARAKAAGAEIIAELEDQFYGDRTYRAKDPEGHEWDFHTHVRDVAPEDMKPPE